MGELVDLLAEAISDDYAVRSVVKKTALAGKVELSGAVEDQWTFVLDAAKSRPEAFDDLLRAVSERLKGTVHMAALQAWMQRGRRREHISDAIREIEISRSQMMSINDPLDAATPLRAMRSALLDLTDFLRHPTDSIDMLAAGDLSGVARIRDRLMAACRKGVAAVDVFALGIQDAGTYLSQAQAAEDVFASTRLIRRQLVDDRNTVDQCATALLGLIAECMPTAAARAKQDGPRGGRS